MDEAKDIIKNQKKAAELQESCFVCSKIDWGMSRMIDTVCRSYEDDRDFRALFDAQDCFCLEHYNTLAAAADKRRMRHYYKEFIKSLTDTTVAYAATLREDLKKYCSMSDYRNNGSDADWGNSRDAVERTVKFLGAKNNY